MDTIEIPRSYQRFLVDHTYSSYNSTNYDVIRKATEMQASTYRTSNYLIVCDMPDYASWKAYGAEIPIYVYSRMLGVFDNSFTNQQIVVGLAGKTILTNVPNFSDYAVKAVARNEQVTIFDTLLNQACEYNGFSHTIIDESEDESVVYSIFHGTVFANRKPALLLCKKFGTGGISTHSKVYLAKSAPEKLKSSIMRYAESTLVDTCLVDTIPYIKEVLIDLHQTDAVKKYMPLLEHYNLENG